MSRAVEFPGHGRFWLTDEGALAPPEHCTETGEVTLEAVLNFFDSPSYGHVTASGEIRRFGKTIGHRDDLVYL